MRHATDDTFDTGPVYDVADDNTAHCYDTIVDDLFDDGKISTCCLI